MKAGIAFRLSFRRAARYTAVSGLAFTLIELLVVIAIIAILAVLLMPALSRTKDSHLEKVNAKIAHKLMRNSRYWSPVGSVGTADP